MVITKSAATDEEFSSVDVGKRLRGLREEHSVSMRELARRSGLSANALSMIERGLTSPSVATLVKLANALEVPITAFFEVEPQRQKVILCRKEDRKRISIWQGVVEAMGGDWFVGQMEAFIVTLNAGSNSGPQGMLHSGHEFSFCLMGSVEFDVDGALYRLEAGDSLMFAPGQTHSWRNPGEDVARMIVVIAGHEEKEKPLDNLLALQL